MIDSAQEETQAGRPEPGARERAASALNLRTVHSLRSLAHLLRHVRRLARSLADSTSPVSKGMRRLQGRGRRLQIAETVQLGEKRFVAILRVDGEQFLIGGSATGVSLLASLPGAPISSAEPVQVVSATGASPANETVAAPSSFHAVLAAQGSHGVRA